MTSNESNFSTVNQQNNVQTNLQEHLESEIARPKTELEANGEKLESENNLCKEEHKKENLTKSTTDTDNEQNITELKQKITEQKLKIKELLPYKSKIEEYEEIIKQLRNDNKELQQGNESFESQFIKLKQRLDDERSEIRLLKQKNSELEEEASNYQSALGVAKDFKMSDDDKNHDVQLNEDIKSLQNNIDIYVTNLAKSKVDVKIEKIIKLLPLYKCQTKIDSNKPDRQFIKAILQRHVLETIIGFAKYYFTRKKKDHYLESDVVRKTNELYELMEKFACARDGTDEITKITPTKLRQLIYTALGMRGLGDIIESGGLYTHKSIINFTEELNESMNQYRVIIDPKKKEQADELAEILILEVFRILFFRLKIQEPIAQYHWFKCGDKVSKNCMEGSWDEDEINDLVVELCTFPLIYQDIDSNRRIFTHAKVFTRHTSGSNSSNDNSDHDEPIITNKIQLRESVGEDQNPSHKTQLRESVGEDQNSNHKTQLREPDGEDQNPSHKTESDGEDQSSIQENEKQSLGIEDGGNLT